MSAVVYIDPTLVSVDTEIEWSRAPFDERARRLHALLVLPDWKVPETSRNLERFFCFLVADGNSFAVALARVDAEITLIVQENGS